MNIGQVIGGCAAIIIGTVLVVYRQAVSRISQDSQRAFFGKLAEDSARNATPGNTLLVSVGFILLGAGLVLSGLGVLTWGG
ncbi:hypothetical protein [Agromyces albus]|uniref:hypothetical protein n=1 Tax=Agromyces albus TaxID=205332 RepID=UPI002786F0F2|nr:hypothetical protein [Agromyces albus]MDQ0577189.1 hypothetical protein [Agromyces albus]